MAIFADTRYQVWLDGSFINRGPARFSRTYKEYDVLNLGSLLTGSHTISILVQWAPNYRRSESISPFLQAHIEGEVQGKFVLAARTGPEWRSTLSDAWRQDSVPIHDWVLIGPTELSDLRKLPADWYQPGFNDVDWKAAEIVNPFEGAQASSSLPQTIYRPRSIDLLAQAEITPTLIDAGYLSPGFVISEIATPFEGPADLQFTSLITTPFTIETLVSEVPSDTIRLDGSPIAWQSTSEDRPDVLLASTIIPAGNHQLSFMDIPSDGITFGVSTLNIEYSNQYFEQSLNPGRRLLLAKPVSSAEAVSRLPNSGFDIEFNRLPAYFVLDLGRTVHGRLQAQVTGPEGSIVDIGWDERLLPGTERPLPYPGSAHPHWSQVDSWILDGSKRSINTLDTRAGRYILVAAWGSGPIKFENITVSEERYPYESVGSFQSSDPLLNRIWQVGVDTLIPNRTDAYTDTPWRERGQWWGDAYVASHIDHVVTGDLKLLKRGLSLMADEFEHTDAPGLAPHGNGTHMLDYSMLWVLSLSDYYQLTGDDEFIYQLYPVVRKFLAHLGSHENPATGLIDLPQGDWSATAYIEPLGYESRFGQSTALNAMYYQTLLKAADLGAISGDAATAEQWQEKAILVRQSANELLFLPGENSYATTYYQEKLYPSSPQAQAWALAYDLPPVESSETLAASLLNSLSADPARPNLDIYGMYWLLEALGRTGQIKEAIGIIESYYGRLLDLGATTWWENFNADQNRAASYSHVWGGSPTWFLSTYVLGARMTGPGEWLAAPALEGVSSASGTVPVGESRLTIGWERKSCQQASISIASDEKTSGEIIIPFTQPLQQLAVNGTIIWKSGAGDTSSLFSAPDGLHIKLAGGSYSLFATYTCENSSLQP